jgi:hypothetical protein
MWVPDSENTNANTNANTLDKMLDILFIEL